MKIASAQIESKVGDIKENLIKHLEMIDIAAQNKANLICFPEMSLTGYCREEGRELAIKESDEEIIKLKEKAKADNIIIVVGAPIEIDDKLYIGSFILNPNGELEIYTKQYLHLGEEVYYSSSFDYNPTIQIADEKIAFAICADIDSPQHPIDAKRNECTLYLPSIFFSKKGIDKGLHLLSKYAKENSFSVLMSNYSGELWNMEAGGKSSFWDKNGEQIAELPPNEQGLLILEKQQNNWTKKILVKEENALQQKI